MTQHSELLGSTDTKASTVRLDSLTGLRWWAAFAVFIFHMRVFAPVPWLSALAPYGNYGVAFFFVLSGFVLTFSARPETTIRNFYWRRFARIYPSHFVALVFAIPVFYSFSPSVDEWWVKPFSIGILLLSVLLLQGWSTEPAILFSGNPAAWTLTVEAFFYLIHPWLLRPLQLLSKTKVQWVVVVVIVFMFGYRALALSNYAPWASDLPLPLVRVSEFLLGMCIAQMVFIGSRARVAPSVLYVALFGFIGAKIIAEQQKMSNVFTQFAHDYLAEILALFFVGIIYSVASRDAEGRRSFMRHPVLVKLGMWSFAFYLVHATVMYIFIATFGELPSSVKNLWWYLPVFAISLLLAWLLYRCVEQPLEAKMRRWGNHRFQQGRR